MARWEPDAAGRLAQAALDLFAERGYDQTTVEDIAVRAGVTKRTFFRHFADKREVLFGGGDAFRQAFLDALDAVPAGTPPLDALAATLDAVAEALFAGRHDPVRRRQLVVAASAELRERELVKLAAVAAALAEALRARGVAEPAASIAAGTATTVFRIALERWVAGPADRELTAVLAESLDALHALAAAPAPP